MPRMTLPGGTEILLGVFHEDTTFRVRGEKLPTKQTRARITVVTKTEPDGEGKTKVVETGESCEALSVCSPSDPFNRKIGRYIAATRLVKMPLVKTFTREDRTFLMRRICPELYRSRNEVDRMEYDRLKKKFDPEPEQPKVA